MLRKLHDALEFFLYLPGAFIDFLMDHRWARVLTTLVVSVLVSLLTMLLLAFLMAAGYIPKSPW